MAGSAYGQRPSASREIDRSKSGRQSNYSESSSGILAGPCALDFFLFGALNGQFSGRIFESPDELVEAIRKIASAIPPTTLGRVFLEWKERLQRCIDINGAYVDESSRWHNLFSPFSSVGLDATDLPDALLVFQSRPDSLEQR
jgi:hypothetical protein